MQPYLHLSPLVGEVRHRGEMKTWKKAGLGIGAGLLLAVIGGFTVYQSRKSVVTVHTGKGTASSTHRYYNKTWYVWNNSGDTAYLKNASGTTVDTCAWSGGGTARYC